MLVANLSPSLERPSVTSLGVDLPTSAAKLPGSPQNPTMALGFRRMTSTVIRAFWYLCIRSSSFLSFFCKLNSAILDGNQLPYAVSNSAHAVHYGKAGTEIVMGDLSSLFLI